MNLVQIRDFLQTVDDEMVSERDHYGYYDQVVRDINHTLSVMDGGLHGPIGKYDHQVTKVCLEEIVCYCINALYDLVPFDTK